MSERTSRDIKELFYQATHSFLRWDDIEPISVQTRCRMINHVVSAIKTDPNLQNFHYAGDSLRALGKSFPVSESYNDWESQRYAMLMRELGQRKHKPLLNIVRDWDKVAQPVREETVHKMTRLHQGIYLSGITEILPISHQFRSMARRHTKDASSLLLGTFKGSNDARRGHILQNTHNDALFLSAEHALDTGHHEMTHGIHFSLALAYSDGVIREDHPLFEEARYFYVLGKLKADIPSRLTDAYRNQTHEFLAEHQGNTISAAIVELARS